MLKLMEGLEDSDDVQKRLDGNFDICRRGRWNGSVHKTHSSVGSRSHHLMRPTGGFFCFRLTLPSPRWGRGGNGRTLLRAVGIDPGLADDRLWRGGDAPPGGKAREWGAIRTEAGRPIPSGLKHHL